MDDGEDARVLLFPDRRSELMMSGEAPTPEVGDVLERNGDKWVVVEVTENPRGSAVRLEPVERADERLSSRLMPLSRHSASSPVYLAGLRIPSEDVRELAARVAEPTRTVLENALDRDTIIVGLSIVDREMILQALDDPQTDALSELREALLNEHQWRTREGLV
jgi:hypothetical protein